MRLIFIILAIFSSLKAKILQTTRIEDALLYLDANSWLLLDIDDTLLETESQLGRVSWVYYEIQKLIQQGVEHETAQKRVFSEWILTQMICPIRTIEPNTATVVAKAQRIAQHVLGLTARPPAIAALSAEQLSKLQIDLSKSAPTLPSDFNWGETAYRSGIWSLSPRCAKGESFARMMASFSENRPKRVIFIDDWRPHLEEMEKALVPLKIEFIGLYYTKAQERPFDPALADLQYSCLLAPLSNAEDLY